MTTTNGNDAPQNPYFPLSCARIDDLYALPQRQTIKRLMGPWLIRQRLTVNEFLHSAAALDKFETAGTTFQHAVQRMAVTLAARSKVPVVEYMKALNMLVSAAIRRVYKDEQAGLFPSMDAQGLSALAATLVTNPKALYVMNGVLAKYLAPARSWDEKLNLVLALRDTCQAHEPETALVLHAADSVAAEIVGEPAVIKDLLGAELPLGASLLMALRLFRGAGFEEVEGGAESLKRLAAYFARDELASARGALARYVLEMCRGTAPLVSGPLDAELKALRTLVDAVTPLYGPFFNAEDFAEAFAARSKRFVTQEALFQLTAACKTPDEKLMRVLDLESQVEGAANKRALAPFALSFLTTHNFEDEFAAGAPGAQRLKRLADLQRRVLKSAFPEGLRDKMAGVLDAMAVRVETSGRLFAELDSRFTDPAERVDMIMKLFENGVFTQGSMTIKARRAILAGISRSGFLVAYTAAHQKDRQAALMELVGQLKKIGISPEESVRAMSPG